MGSSFWEQIRKKVSVMRVSGDLRKESLVGHIHAV